MTAQSGLGFAGIVAIQIPDDGATGEVLTKQTPDDYDFDWDPSGGAGPTVDPGTIDDTILRWNGATPAWEEFASYILPLADGVDGQAILTDGAGTLSFGTVSSGGLLSAQYRFSSSIVAADPGAGRFRYDSAAYGTVTQIFIDDFTSQGVDVSNFLALITTGDRLYIQAENDSDEFAVWNVLAPSTDNVGWFTIDVELQAGGNFLNNNDRTLFMLQIGGARTSFDWVEFVAQAVNPGGVPAFTLYQDDGTNFDADTVAMGDLTIPMMLTGNVGLGDPGTEQGGVNVGGVNFDATQKINDFGGTVDAMLVLHRHSTSFGSNLVMSRSNSDTAAHAALTAGQTISQMVHIGWSGTHYDIAAFINVDVPLGTTISPTSLAGEFQFFTTPDLSNTSLLAMIIGSDQIIYGGEGVGDTLTLKGSKDAALGFLDILSPVEIDVDWTISGQSNVIEWNTTIPSSGAAVSGFMRAAPEVHIDSGLFIFGTVIDQGRYLQEIAPGFAVHTLFLGQPNLETETAGIQPNQVFIYAAQPQMENNGAGGLGTPIPNVIGMTVTPQLLTRVAGDTLSVTNLTGMQVGPSFSTVAFTTINFGTIRGVHMTNPVQGLFSPGAGVEAMTAYIGLEVNAIPFGGNVTKAAVRSALVDATNTRFLDNIGTAQSDFGAGDIHLDDNTAVEFGASLATPDMLLFWASATSAMRFAPFFGTGGNPLEFLGTAADEWIFRQAVGLDIGIQFDMNAISFGTTLPTPNANNWFTIFAAPSGRQVQIGGEYSDVLWTAGGFIDVNGMAVSDLQAFKINSPSIVLNGGSIADLSNLYVAAMPSFGGTRMQALRVLGRSRLDGLMTHNEETLTQLTGDVAALALPPNNLGRFVLLQDADALGPWTIQGIVNVQVGDSVYLINNGANAWDFGHEDGAAAAIDRIITPTAATWTLGAREFAKLWYDPVATRWRILESNGA